MKDVRIVDRVPLPIRATYETWRGWGLKVADEMVDAFPELQKNTLESEALFSAVVTAISKIPAGCLGDISEITLFSILHHAMGVLEATTYLQLGKKSGASFRYLPALATKFVAGLAASNVTVPQWCREIGLDEVEVGYWVSCGLHLRSSTRTVVDSWMQVHAPWPIPAELKEYFQSIRGGL